jgi:serine/threonine-protein kinase
VLGVLAHAEHAPTAEGAPRRPGRDAVTIVVTLAALRDTYVLDAAEAVVGGALVLGWDRARPCGHGALLRALAVLGPGLALAAYALVLPTGDPRARRAGARRHGRLRAGALTPSRLRLARDVGAVHHRAVVESSSPTRPAPAGATEAVPAVGELVAGKYRVEALLGTGGAGAVLGARNELTGRAVALKRLHAGVNDPQARARFLREARAAGRVRHAHVADILDVVDDPTHGLLLVLERLEGETVAQRLARGSRPEQEALRIARDVADALVAAHAAGVVHRDLKPSNVFLSREEGGERVKVLDFGLARVMDEPDRLTRSDQIVGTPHYLAPEQVMGVSTDPRSDVWALGATLYELLAGAPPYDRASASALLVAIATEPVPPLAPRAPQVSPETCALVMSLLAKNAADRPDAAEARARLEARLEALGQPLAPREAAPAASSSEVPARRAARDPRWRDGLASRRAEVSPPRTRRPPRACRSFRRMRWRRDGSSDRSPRSSGRPSPRARPWSRSAWPPSGLRGRGATRDGSPRSPIAKGGSSTLPTCRSSPLHPPPTPPRRALAA